MPGVGGRNSYTKSPRGDIRPGLASIEQDVGNSAIGMRPMRQISMSTNIAPSDYRLFVYGTQAITLMLPAQTALPSALSANGTLSKTYEIINTNVGTVTILTQGGVTVNGKTQMTLNAYETVVLTNDGTNWYVLGGVVAYFP